MKGDAVIRVHRSSWQRARDFAQQSGRDLREVTAAALDDYVKRQERDRLLRGENRA